MLTCEKKVEDDSKSFGLTNYKNKLAIYGDGGRLGEEQVWGRNQECIIRHVTFEMPIRHSGCQIDN